MRRWRCLRLDDCLTLIAAIMTPVAAIMMPCANNPNIMWTFSSARFQLGFQVGFQVGDVFLCCNVFRDAFACHTDNSYGWPVFNASIGKTLFSSVSKAKVAIIDFSGGCESSPGIYLSAKQPHAFGVWGSRFLKADRHGPGKHRGFSNSWNRTADAFELQRLPGRTPPLRFGSWHRPHSNIKGKTPINRLGWGGNNLLNFHI